MKRYDQPFYVPIALRHRFPTVDRFGYLPPIELPEPPDEDVITDDLRYTVEDLRRQVRELEHRREQRQAQNNQNNRIV